MSRIDLEQLKRLAARAVRFTDRDELAKESIHPFDQRNISPRLPQKVRDLFDDGHYQESAFVAFKFIDKEIQRHSKLRLIGKSLMMSAFSENQPPVAIADVTTDTGRNQQEGFRFLTAGGVLFVRNPRGHEVDLMDSPDDCLSYLSFATLILRELSKAGYR